MVPKGSVLTVSFELDGQKFTALNGGPAHTFTDAISFVVRCDSQDEIDYYWSKLTAGRNRGRMRLAEGQIRPIVADCAGADSAS